MSNSRFFMCLFLVWAGAEGFLFQGLGCGFDEFQRDGCAPFGGFGEYRITEFCGRFNGFGEDARDRGGGVGPAAGGGWLSICFRGEAVPVRGLGV